MAKPRPFYLNKSLWIALGVAVLLGCAGLTLVFWPAAAGAVGAVAGTLGAVGATWAWQKFNEMIKRIFEEVRETRANLAKETGAIHTTIAREMVRNSKIEAKAERAATKVEAVAEQVSQNKLDLEMLKILMEERSEDKKIIAHLLNQLKEKRGEED